MSHWFLCCWIKEERVTSHIVSNNITHELGWGPQFGMELSFLSNLHRYTRPARLLSVSIPSHGL
jgi:hypothetical protein